MVFRPLDKLHDDEEVARKAHLVDDLELDIQPLIVLATFLGANLRIRKEKLQPLLEPLLGAQHQIIFRRHLTGRKFRQKVLTQPHRHVTALGNLDRVLQSLRQIGEQLGHLLLTLQVLLGTESLGATAIIQGITVMDCDSDFVGFEVLLITEYHLVGRHHRQRRLLRQRDSHADVGLFVGAPGTDQLQIETVGKMVLIEGNAARHHGLIALEQKLADIPLATTGEQYHPRLVFDQPLLIDDRQPLHMATQIALGDELHQILLAIVVHRQPRQAKQLLTEFTALNPEIDADQRFHPLAMGFAIETDQATLVHLVGEGHRRHAMFCRSRNERLDLLQSIDHREVGMDAQVYEARFCHLRRSLTRGNS